MNTQDTGGDVRNGQEIRRIRAEGFRAKATHALRETNRKTTRILLADTFLDDCKAGKTRERIRNLADLAEKSATWTDEELQRYIRWQEEALYRPAQYSRLAYTDKELFTSADCEPSEDRRARAAELFDTVKGWLTSAQARILEIARTSGAWSAAAIVPFTVSTTGKRKGSPMARQTVVFHMSNIVKILKEHRAELDGFDILGEDIEFSH